MRSSALASLLLATFLALTGPATAEGPPIVFVRPQPSGPPGAQLRVVGLGFAEGQRVEVRWNGTEGEQVATASGPDFTADFTVPVTARRLNTLVAVTRNADGVLGGGTTASFLVTGTDERSSDPAPLAGAPGLPSSPAPTPSYVWAALALGGLGAAVILGRERRRRTGQPAGSGPGPASGE